MAGLDPAILFGGLEKGCPCRCSGMMKGVNGGGGQTRLPSPFCIRAMALSISASLQAKDSRIVHFIGKDNIVFHCLIFPAMCMAHGEFQLADQVPANEFMNLEGDKISTSRNWAVWLHEYLQDFPGKQDV